MMDSARQEEKTVTLFHFIKHPNHSLKYIAT